MLFDFNLPVLNPFLIGFDYETENGLRSEKKHSFYYVTFMSDKLAITEFDWKGQKELRFVLFSSFLL